MEGTFNQTTKNAMWQNIRTKEGSKCMRLPRVRGCQARMVEHSGRKYMYFARRVSSAILRIPTTQPLLIHRAHTAWPQGTQWFWMFCCHLPEKQSLKSPASVPGLCSHIYSRVHEEYWSRHSCLYMGMYPWFLVPILELFNNVVITAALIWGQCFSPLQGGCFRTSPSFLSQTFECSPSAFSVHFHREYPISWDLPDAIWSLNRTGLPSRRQLTPLVGNRAVPVR